MSKSRTPQSRKARRIIRTYLRCAIVATSPVETKEVRAHYTARCEALESQLSKAV